MKNKAHSFAAILIFGGLTNSASAQLFAHFKFDEGSGLVAHNSAGSVNGEIKNYNGAPTGGWVEGPPGFGGAYNFNGTDSVDMPLAALDALDWAGENPTKVTVAYWKKGNNLPNDSTYPYAEDFMVRGMWLHSWSHWNPFLGAGLVYQAANAGMGFTDQIGGPAPADSLNEWHHYALTKDAETGEMKTYIDGNIIGNVAAFHKKFAAPIKFDIGSHGGNNAFHGTIDDFRMYNRALTDDEVFALLTPATSNPGDYNEDGSIDAADYVVWRKDPASFGGPDGYNTWRANFGLSAALSSAATLSSAVPEPTSIAVFVSWLAAGLAMKRARRTQSRGC